MVAFYFIVFKFSKLSAERSALITQVKPIYLFREYRIEYSLTCCSVVGNSDGIRRIGFGICPVDLPGCRGICVHQRVMEASQKVEYNLWLHSIALLPSGCVKLIRWIIWIRATKNVFRQLARGNHPENRRAPFVRPRVRLLHVDQSANVPNLLVGELPVATATWRSWSG